MYLTTYLRTLSVLRYKQLQQWLPLRRQLDYTHFVVLCHPRSGSTLLHTYLNSHPVIISKGEKVTADLRHQPKLLDNNYLSQKVFQPQPFLIKAVGIKFFVNLATQPKGENLLGQLNDIPNLKVILLKRKNPLRVIVSSRIAEKTRQMSAWTKAQDLKVEGRRIHLSPEECLGLLEKMEEEFIQAETSLVTQSRLTIFYEDMINDKEATLRQIQQFLQVPPRKLFTLLRRQNPEPLSSLVSNYDELANCLKSTHWKHLLIKE